MNVPFATTTRLLFAFALLTLPLVAGANTLERVRSSHTFTLGYLPDLAPFSKQEGDKASGYAIDLCLKVADKLKSELGLPDLQVHYLPVTVADQVSAVSQGKVDILCTPTAPTLERRKMISYSIPVYTAGLSVVVRNDAAEPLLNVLNGKVATAGPTWRASINNGLANQTYATLEGGVTEDWIRERMRLLNVIASLVTVANNDEGVKLVAEGKADAFFSERMLLRNEIAKEGAARNLMILDRIFEYSPVAMMVDRNDEDFRLLVDTALSEAYYSGFVEKAYDQYLGGSNLTVKRLFRVYALP
ncbi:MULTISPECIES: amino acid ABC transporter substrate-binding protein [unclassified Pseudomonas]|uniref:amino acid ABC transporter substrate-binding protein n=1 Tax=unclassified Pseudomonas TaxID=196821 RepID=UPI000BB31F76|nr:MULTISPECIES: amino acid ABC transporter substrate-binding protein [unclassified Pseudomonas]PBJ04676.1 Glutamate/aspartate periplasmic-binding protein precursor [Pseudomonas sp. ACN5]PMZ73149.1 amino acid ABC transporter substrate-binding protein [Pseudomonas sp. FW305-70]